jgi:hypothetical protein
MPSTAWTPLANLTLTSAQATVTFSDINQSYKDLVLIISAIPVSNAVTGYMRVNGDTGANYALVGMRGNGSDTASYAVSGSNMYFDYAGDTGAGTTTNSIINFMDYSSTNKHKTNITRQSNTGDAVEQLAQKWASTSAITSISLYWSSGNFASGSTFALYGVSA